MLPYYLRACDACFVQKKRCDLIYPSCSRCLRQQKTCIYSKTNNHTLYLENIPLHKSAESQFNSSLPSPCDSQSSICSIPPEPSRFFIILSSPINRLNLLRFFTGTTFSFTKPSKDFMDIATISRSQILEIMTYFKYTLFFRSHYHFAFGHERTFLSTTNFVNYHV